MTSKLLSGELLSMVALATVFATACAPAAAPSPTAAQKPAATAVPAAKPAATVAPAAKPAAKKDLKKITYRLASPMLDASKSNVAIAQRLGYFAEEGLDVDYGTVQSGTGEATAMLASGAIQYVGGGPDAILAAEARGQDLGLTYFYRETKFSIFSQAAVLPDSPIKDYPDLKGKTIGVLSLDPGPTLLPKAIVREKGVNPDTDVTWVAIGTGAQAWTALQRKQVDAVFFWDTSYALMETIGAQFRYLSPSTQSGNIFYTGLFTKRDTLQNNRQDAIGLGRGMAKGTAFQLANPELAVKMLWAQYPQTKPQGQDDATALKSQLHILESRAAKLTADEKTKKWGIFDPVQWETYAKVLDMDASKMNFSRLYTNDLIDEINKFDTAAIEKQAKGMTAVP